MEGRKMSDEAKTTIHELTPLKESFSIQLEMKSDWHIGSGAGRPGDVDRLVLRDKSELPYVPAKTLTGIWRDACERVALGLDNGSLDLGEKGEIRGWSAWIGFLFGEQAGHLREDRPDLEEEESRKVNQNLDHPRPAALSIRSVHLPTELRVALKGKDAAREAVTFVKPGVGISPRSGRAKTDFLRFEEMARAGANLDADCRIDWSGCETEDEKRAATALLVAGARLVERIGGKRRRGVGRCELIVDGRREIEDALDWIERHSQPPSPPKADKTPVAISLRKASRGDWQVYDLIVTAKTPLIIAARTIGNLIETTDYIPGAQLLAVISRQLKQTAVNDAIVNGDLMVTNATIEIDGESGRPVPFCLYQEKLGDGLKGDDTIRDKVYNRFHDDTDGKPQVKGYRNGYIGKTAVKTLPRYRTVKREVEMHNVVEDEVQRPTDEVGGVFSYQAIRAGTTLRAELRLQASVLEAMTSANPRWLEALTGDYRLGRSKKDDYGLVNLVVRKKDEDEKESSLKAGANSKLTIWLLSDLLLRDERLRPAASIEQLRKKLGNELKAHLKVREDSSQKFLSRLSRQNRMDSWQVAWELPRPSLVGLAAGTCVIFEVEGELDESRLAEIERDGLGERRAEGYGRMRFNDPMIASLLEDAKRQGKGPSSSSTGNQGDAVLVSSPATFEYARLIEREAVRREIGRKALRFAGDRDKRRDELGIDIVVRSGERKSEPPMSQLGALRSVVGRLRGATEDDKKAVTGWLEHLEATTNRIEKWPKEGKESKDGKVRLKHLRALIERKDRVWELLGLTDLSKLVITETGANDMKTELWAEAVRTLVDACVRAQKRETEKREGENGEKN
jgi:CRISPR-associated protein Csx10